MKFETARRFLGSSSTLPKPASPAGILVRIEEDRPSVREMALYRIDGYINGRKRTGDFAIR